MALHPSDDELALLAENAADARSAALVRAHLAECAECASTIAELKRALAPAYRSVSRTVDELPAGTTLGRFVIERRVGAGVSSTVYSAHDPVLSRTVALKVLRPTVSPSQAAQVLEEARRLARVHHPNVTAVFDVGTSGALQWIAMEYLDGVSLRVHLQTHRCTWESVFELFRAIAAGLSAAHAAQVVQRDLKPENVMVTRAGRAVVTDFGLAASADELEPLRDALIGTPAYMAPEQLEGRPATAASDQFAFFVCLAEALFGERPFAASSVPALLAQMRAAPVEREPVVTPRSTADLERVRQALRRGLSLEPADRFPSMDAAWNALADVFGPRRARSTRALVVALGVSMVLGAAGTWWARREAAPCQPARVLAPVWNDEVRRRFATDVEALHSPLATEQVTRVTSAVDAYAASWAATYTHVCEGTSVRRDQSAELLDVRMRCLDRRLTGLSALLAALERPDLKVVLQATRAVASLEGAHGCRETTVASLEPMTPAEERTLATTEAALLTGRFSEAVDHARTLLTTASEPSRADAHRLEGRGLAKLGRLAEAEQSLVTASQEALVHHRPRVFVQAMTNLAFLQATGLARPDEAARTEQLARGQLAALGTPPELETELDNAAAFVEVAKGRFDAARTLLSKALAARAALALPNDPFVCGLRSNLAMVLELNGALEPAMEAHSAAIRAWEGLVGPRHPDPALARFNHGVLLANTGDDVAAMVEFDAALAIRLETLGPRHALVATTEAARALSLARLGRRESSEQALTKALELSNGLSPTVEASVLNTAGQVRLARGELELATKAFEQARAARSPTDTALAYDLVGLARVALKKKDECGRIKPLLTQAATLRLTAAPPLRAEVTALQARCEEGAAREEALAAARALFAKFPTARRLALDSLE